MTATHSPASTTPERLRLSAIGAGAGLTLWFLFEILPDLTENDRLSLALVLFSGGFFAVLLAAIGPLRLRDAARISALVATVSTALFTWAGVRFETVDGLFETGHVFVSYALLVTIPVPFLIAARRPNEGWHSYPALFDHAWGIIVRYATAWVFTGIFWGVLFLSDAVLKIVGIDIIETLLDIEPLPYLLTGLVLGFGLAVVHELSHMISPTLILRLLRLLLPLVFAVSLIFVIAAPINGLSGLFGDFSAAATLMGMAIAAVTLITVSLDQTAASAATAPLLTWSARLTCLLVPVMGALALWAVLQRIGQYGLTPTRVAAVTGAAITLAYGIAYAIAVLPGRGWGARIRRANIGLALAMIALAALWLTPVLNAERLSVRSQIARFEAGKTELDDLDLWSLAHDWGRAGARALEPLRAPDHPQAAALAEVFARLDGADNRWQFENGRRSATLPKTYEELLAIMPVVPEGARLPDDITDLNETGSVPALAPILDGCKRRTPANAPACVAIVADFDLGPGNEVLMLHWNVAAAWVEVDGFPGVAWQRVLADGAGARLDDPALIDRIQAGDFALAPLPVDALILDDIAIGVRP